MSAAFDQWADPHRRRLEALIDHHLPAADPAAARLFENYPHMNPFPCDGVEVMPIMEIPQMPE